MSPWGKGTFVPSPLAKSQYPQCGHNSDLLKLNSWCKYMISCVGGSGQEGGQNSAQTASWAFSPGEKQKIPIVAWRQLLDCLIRGVDWDCVTSQYAGWQVVPCEMYLMAYTYLEQKAFIGWLTSQMASCRSRSRQRSTPHPVVTWWHFPYLWRMV